jgi:hypothetical protein
VCVFVKNNHPDFDLATAAAATTACSKGRLAKQRSRIQFFVFAVALHPT